MLKRYLEDAEELKQEGNDYFRAGKWTEALASYHSALGRLPKRKAIDLRANKGKQRETVDDIEKEDNSDDAKPEPEPEPLAEPTALDIQCAKARATLNANIGACYVKLVSVPTHRHRKLLTCSLGRAQRSGCGMY